MIFIIDDDEIMAKCVERATGSVQTKIFRNAIAAMETISDGVLPDLIFLDILLDGPDGFTFLNEMISYPDTAEIPVVIISSLDFKDVDAYKLAGILNKETMKPEDIRGYVERYAK